MKDSVQYFPIREAENDSECLQNIFNPSIQKVEEGDCCKSEIQSGEILSHKSREHRAVDGTQLLKSVYPAGPDPWGQC